MGGIYIYIYIGSDATVFFANTHGALPSKWGDCDGAHGHEVAKNYIDTINANIQPGDAMVLNGISWSSLGSGIGNMC